MHDASIDRWLSRMFPPDGDGLHVYALLDAARDPSMMDAVRASGLPSRCLFEGPLCASIVAAAPHLVQMTRTSALCEWLFVEGWGRSLGIFAWSRADLRSMQRHFRALLRVRDEQGRNLYFRYYDPRVLRVYVPTCEPDELDRLLGPAQALLCESERGHVTTYGRERSASCS